MASLCVLWKNRQEPDRLPFKYIRMYPHARCRCSLPGTRSVYGDVCLEKQVFTLWVNSSLMLERTALCIESLGKRILHTYLSKIPTIEKGCLLPTSLSSKQFKARPDHGLQNSILPPVVFANDVLQKFFSEQRKQLLR